MAVGNLEFIKSASVTSASSLSVTDCFSVTYDVYFFEFANVENSASTNHMIRLIDSGGTPISESEYDWAILQFQAGGDLNVYNYTATNQSSNTSFSFVSRKDADATGLGISGYFFNPNDSSSYTFYKSQTSFISTNHTMRKMIGVHKVAEQITGFQIFPDSGTFTLDVSVYGVK
jgi:hypothetical protein